MSSNSLRDHFSAYYEGSLEPGLVVVLENAFRTDPSLQAEYERFSETLDSLGHMAVEDIPIPNFLSDRIQSRLNVEAPKARWYELVWIRQLGFTAVAATAIIGAVVAIQSKDSGTVAQAGIASSNQPQVTTQSTDILKVSVEGGDATATFTGSTSKSVIVTDHESQKLLKKYDVTAGTVQIGLENPGAEAFVFQVDVTGEKRPTLVVVPPVTPSTTSDLKGTGGVIDLLKYVSNRFDVHIQITAENVKDTVRWDGIKSASAKEILEEVLPKNFTIQASDDLIVIQDR